MDRGMRHSFSERAAPALGPLALGALAPALALQLLHGRHSTFSGTFHFAAVGVTALAAAVAAFGLTVVGARRGDGRAVLVGTGFTVMAALLAIHGLATPGMLIGQNGVIALTGAATLPIGGAVLALSALPALRRPRDIRTLLGLQVSALVAVTGLGIVGMAIPDVVPPVPAPGGPAAIVALIVGVFLYSILVLRSLKTYLLTRRVTDLAVVIGVAWLTAALPPALLFNYMDLGWWLGHLFELAGIVIVGATVAVDLRRSAQSRSLVGDLRAEDLVAQEEAFLGARVRALTQLLADKDEFDVVKRHPERGVKLLRELGGFPASVQALVHSHHERLDGQGYPRGLGDSALALDTRILTVCDVYDALVSPRVYRAAWSHEAAIGLLREESGTAFDERCVAALEAVLRRNEPQPVVATLRIAAASA